MKMPRKLSHDERKASEAAFRGLPVDDRWTDSAKSVYEGILKALGAEPPSPITSQSMPSASTSDATLNTDQLKFETLDSLSSKEVQMELGQLTIQSRREAIKSGILKDVTPAAQSIGLDFCVGLTNPLWDQYITTSPDFTDTGIQERIRQALVAVRLRLASLKIPTPLVDVPLLLDFAPEPTPQLCLSFALFHKDPVDGDCLLLIHPGEVFATRQAFENN